MAIRVEINEQAHSVLGKSGLSNIHFNLPANSCTLLMGASGAGKSTIKSVLIGQAKFDGSIVISGTKNIAWIDQSPCLDPMETVDNAVFYAAQSAYRVPLFARPELKRYCDSTIDALGLSDIHHMKYRNLSGGQQRRVAIAAELVRGADFIVADEIDTGLDYATSIALAKQIKQLAHERGVSSLVISHNTTTAEWYDNLVILAKNSQGTTGLAYAGTMKDAFSFFDNAKSLGDIICEVNPVEEGGKGKGAHYIARFQRKESPVVAA